MEKLPNLSTPESRQEEIDKVWQEKEGQTDADKKEKEPIFDLEKTRSDYVKSYTEYKQVFGGVKKKELAEIEKTTETAKEHLKEKDSQKEKENFIKELIKCGVKEKQAEAIYNTELKKAEYDAAKVQEGKRMKERGVPQAEIFQKLFLKERELLNEKKLSHGLRKRREFSEKGWSGI